MRKRVLITTVSIILILIGYFAVKGKRGEESSAIFVDPEVGRFEVVIETTGELEAKNSTKILGPARLRDYRIFQVAINEIVEEGTVVKKGDWVATLDNSELLSKVQDANLEVDRMRSQYVQTQLDTALQMRQARDELINLDFAVTEREIELEQSKFEPPATQRQTEMNLDKAKRELQQAKENYVIKQDQNIARMAEVNANLQKELRDLHGMENLLQSFRIMAPEAGMVIYKKGFDGKPMKEGSTINGWDPTVAELPDLTTMISKTYVNEVDVRKIKVGQQVEIGLDAFPEKKIKGSVIRVANVGEQRPNSDAKVFLVTIQVFGTDDLLRPAMTTSNKIITQVVDSALYVPLEALHTEFDSITYVYLREGLNISKQEVIVGSTNVNEAIIKGGIDPDDRLYLSVPSGQEGKEIALLPEMDGKRNQPEPEVEEVVAQERTITLPDGRTITVSADQADRMQRMRQGGSRTGGRQGAGRSNGDQQQNQQNQKDQQKKQGESQPAKPSN